MGINFLLSYLSMVSILGSSDTWATTWTLTGSTVAYTGSLTTDGYKLKAAMVFKNGGTTTSSGETLTATSSKVGHGTCVATLVASTSAAPTSTDATVGNFALCHFIFYTVTSSAGVDSGAIENAYTGTHWGVTKYLTSAQWGATTAGSGIIGNTMNTSTGGTAITSANWGLVFDPSTTLTKFTQSSTYSMEWYQPTYKSTYTASELRRYGGGYNNSTADKVKGYCIGARLITATANVSQGITAGSTVTLSGASALAAGAIALGVAALAI